MLVMEVIVRPQVRALCASITSITGTYAEPEGRVIFDHRHNADESVSVWPFLCTCQHAHSWLAIPLRADFPALLAVRGVAFRWKAESGNADRGVCAVVQQESVDPGAVGVGTDDVTGGVD